MILNKKFLYFALAWFVSSGIAVFLRLYPLINHTPFDVSEKATVFVVSNLQKKVSASINQKFPNIPPAEKQKLIQKNVSDILRTQNSIIKKTIKKISESIEKDSKDIQPYPYLLASDSYYYYNLTENIVKTGKIGKKIKGSKYFNELMFAPLGFWEPLNFHPYIGFAVYKVMGLFNPNIPLMHAVSYTPLLITILTLIPFIFICASFGCSPFVSMISATLFSAAPIYLKRSMFGWYDNDPYSIFFPLIILCVLFHAITHISKRKNNILPALLCSLLLTIYSVFWHGWVFFLSIIFISGIIIIICNHFVLRQKSVTKNYLIFFGTILFGTLVGINFVFGIKEFFVLFREGWIALKNFLEPQLSLWPDLYFSVGELKKTPYNAIIDLTGGIFFSLLAIIGLGASAIHSYKEREASKLYKLIIITVFLLTSFVISKGALRFALLFLIPLSLLFPLGLKHVLKRFDSNVENRYPNRSSVKKFSKIAINFICIIILALLLYSKYMGIPKILNKIFNTSWEKTLTQIKEKTPSDSIINTWWTPGHFIKAIANRRVTFDGATINNPQGYWLSKVFMSTSEEQALGLLRMLNASANQAAEYLQTEVGLKLSDSVKILNKITSLNISEAKRYLKNNAKLDNKQSFSLLKLTHKKPSPSYLLIFNEMVEKNLEFKLFSGWNFEKMEELEDNPQLLETIPNKNSKEYIQFLWDLAGGPYRYSGPLPEIARKGSIIRFQNNVSINLTTKECRISSGEYGKGIPRSIFYVEGNKLIEKQLPGASLSYSVILVRGITSYKCVLLDRKLARSLLMKLYFFGGKGFKYISPLIKESDQTKRTKIYLYEIDWNKFISNN